MSAEFQIITLGLLVATVEPVCYRVPKSSPARRCGRQPDKRESEISAASRRLPLQRPTDLAHPICMVQSTTRHTAGPWVARVSAIATQRA